MKLESEFTVSAPVQQAWEAMLDLERIAPCLPGAAIEEATDEEYQGTMAVKLGPISARYRGTVSIEETDEESHRAVLKANGRETRGQGSASATISSTMSEKNGGTRVHVETDVQVTGRVAQFGRGIMQDVASELMDRFSTCLEQEIVGGSVEEEPGQPAEALERAAISTERQESKTSEAPPREAQPLDLGVVSRGAVAKRAAPILAGLAGLVLATVLTRYLRRPYFLVRFEIRRR